jgi:hypothetical protein
MGNKLSTTRTQTAYELLVSLKDERSIVLVGNKFIKVDLPQSVKNLLEDLYRFNWAIIYVFDMLNIRACITAIEQYLSAHDGNISGKKGSSLERWKSEMEYHLSHMERSAKTMKTRRTVFTTGTTTICNGDSYGTLEDIRQALPVTELSLTLHADDLRRALGMLKRLCIVALNETTTLPELEVLYNWFRYGQKITPKEVIEERRKLLSASVTNSDQSSDLPTSSHEDTEAIIEAQWITNMKASAGSNSSDESSSKNEDEQIVSIEVFNGILDESTVQVVEEEQEAPKPHSPIGTGCTAPQESLVPPSKKVTILVDEARANAMGDHEDSTIPPIEEANALLALARSETRKELKVYHSTIALCNVLIENYEGMHTESIRLLFPIIKDMLNTHAIGVHL